MKHKKDLEGCVYFFLKDYNDNYNYNSPEKKKLIHKMLENDFFVSNELTNIPKIRKYRNMFYVCEESSTLHIKDIDDYEPTYTKNKIDDSILLDFEDRELIYLKPYLKALSSSRKYIFSIITFYKKLLSSIQLLVDNNLVHNNINFDSIVIDNLDNPLLSNFTLSINISREDIDQYIKQFIIEYDPTYIEWPMEFHILAYLLTNKIDSLSGYNIETVISNVVDNHNILKTFGKEFVSSYKTEAQHYFKKFVNRSYEYILTDILQYSSTWDNYSLSIMFLRILIGIHRTIGIKNKFIILFMKLLVSNIHLNPLKRLSIESTQTHFDSMLDNMEIKDYKEVLDNLTST